MVQWVRLPATNAGILSSIPGQGTRSSMIQLRVHMLQLKSQELQLRSSAAKINKRRSTSVIHQAHFKDGDGVRSEELSGFSQ